MVKALLDIDEHTNHVLNVVKAKYDLNDKADAIELIVEEYEEYILEPALRPVYVEKMKKRQKEKEVEVQDFNKEFGLD